tara:strand:- start:35 stop:442 length:408 start_codon:yes stop_codon:yes gene_type:complete
MKKPKLDDKTLKKLFGDREPLPWNTYTEIGIEDNKYLFSMKPEYTEEGTLIHNHLDEELVKKNKKYYQHGRKVYKNKFGELVNQNCDLVLKNIYELFMSIEKQYIKKHRVVTGNPKNPLNFFRKSRSRQVIFYNR